MPDAGVAVAVAQPTKTLEVLFEQKLQGDVRGIALDGQRLLVNVALRGAGSAGVLQVFDAHGPVMPSPVRSKPLARRMVVGDDAFDVVSQTRQTPTPHGLTCSTKAFSADASRMSCYDFAGNGGQQDAVYVIDTETGTQLGVFKEFQTAAPIRSGTITESGNFIFWVARSAGAFEEIKSHVTGPMMSSHSVMAPDEHLVFTAPDRNWYVDDHSRANVIDPKNGRTVFTLPPDVDTVFFSPTSRMMAARHSQRWGDMQHVSADNHTFLTLHAGSADVVAEVRGGDPQQAAFAADDGAMAVLLANGVIRVYAVR